MTGFAWVTLATDDSYSLGALVLGQSLRNNGTSHKLVVLITTGVTKSMRDILSTVFDVVQEVDILDSKDETNLKLLQRPELGITFTKLHCWRLTQFEKCVFLDADTLVLQNCDELFEREELSAAPDVGWPDCFNSGVFVYRPSNETYEKLVTFAIEKGSFDGGDQGLLNSYFSDWAISDISKHLPFIYNLSSVACYSYLPAFKQYGGSAKIVHFIGTGKPWLQSFNPETRKVRPAHDMQHLGNVLQSWFDIFCSTVYPQLTADMNNFNNESTACNNTAIVDPWEDYDNASADLDSFSNNKEDNEIQDFSNLDLANNEPVTKFEENECLEIEPTSCESNLILVSNLNSIDQCSDDGLLYNPFTHTTNTCTSQSVSHSDHSSQDRKVNTQLPNASNNVLSNEHTADTNAFNDILLHSCAEECSNAGLAGVFAQLTLDEPGITEIDPYQEYLRRSRWEEGNIDYMGKDSFDNIWSKISETLTNPASLDPSETAEPSIPGISETLEEVIKE